MDLLREEKKTADRNQEETEVASNEQIELLQAQLRQAMDMAENMSRRNKQLSEQNAAL